MFINVTECPVLDYHRFGNLTRRIINLCALAMKNQPRSIWMEISYPREWTFGKTSFLICQCRSMNISLTIMRTLQNTKKTLNLQSQLPLRFDHSALPLTCYYFLYLQFYLKKYFKKFNKFSMLSRWFSIAMYTIYIHEVIIRFTFYLFWFQFSQSIYLDVKIVRASTISNVPKRHRFLEHLCNICQSKTFAINYFRPCLTITESKIYKNKSSLLFIWI